MNPAWHLCRRPTAWLGIFALLFQAWLPLVHHPATLFAPSGHETAAFDQMFGEDPMPSMAPDAGRKTVPPSDKAPAHHPPLCPICQALHAIGGLAPPLGVAVLVVLSVGFYHYLVQPNARDSIALFRLSACPRAPPLPV